LTAATSAYDAILVVGFGGPEKREDVIPFLENVLRGRNVPRERMLDVARHYDRFDGKSPINDQMRDLIAALGLQLAAHNIRIPIYWGNRNWHPLLADTLREMTAAGVRRAICYVASAYSSYSGCRQYLGDIEQARAVAGPDAPQVDKLRIFFNHPRFIAANALRLSAALDQTPPGARGRVHVAFTAHSIPLYQASGCQYESQLRGACRLTAKEVGLTSQQWQLVYQSRSGLPQDPWLGPDIGDHLRDVRASGTSEVVIMPIGFLSDHMEVLYDLDCEARQVCDETGLSMVRAATVGTHPLFVQMICELIEERVSGSVTRPVVGDFPAWPDECPEDCCPRPRGGVVGAGP
jgi:ferrochelatase